MKLDNGRWSEMMSGRQCRRAFGGGVAALLTVASLIGFPNLASARTTSLKAPSQVHIGLIGGYLTPLAAWMVAVGPNYLGKVAKQFHTTFVIDPYGGPAPGSAAFFGGTDQFLETGSGQVATFATEGQDILSLFSGFTGFGSVLVGSAKYSSSIGKNIAGYNGKSWCFPGFGASGELNEIGAATAAGLNWANQSQVNIGTTTAFLSTMQSGQCDITAMDTTTAAKAILQGIGYLVLNPNTVPEQQKLFGGVQVGSCLCSSNAFVKQYPALTQAMVTAFVQAELFLQANAKNPNKIYGRLPASFVASNPVGAFAQQWSLTYPSYLTTNGLVPTKWIASTIAFSQAHGQFALTYRAPAGFTNKYVYGAYASLGFPRPSSSGAPDKKVVKK